MTIARVSIGSDIRRPGLLSAEPIGTILTGIGGGRWAEPITSLRRLPYHSSDFDDQKRSLPYWTPSGLFRHRSAAGLVQHSGHLAIDLDDLGEQGATRTIQAAVADACCLAAFRSVSGRGVRLVFPCPPSSAAHKAMFAHVAGHVRSYYHQDPDLSGADVSRACFVSYDNGMWLNPSATVLPQLAEIAKCYTEAMLCNRGERGTGLSSGDRLTLAYGLGESRASCSLRADGTAETNAPLMHLGKDLAVRYQKHHLALTGAEIDLAFNSWFASCRRQGFKFSKSRSDYRDELEKLVRSAERAPWLSRTVNRWLRWTHDPDFPSAGSAEDRLAFAIGKHCTEAGSPHFFLSARDAATIAGGHVHFVQANRILHRLVRAGVLARVGKPLHARHAQSYRLIAKDSASRLLHAAKL